VSLARARTSIFELGEFEGRDWSLLTDFDRSRPQLVCISSCGEDDDEDLDDDFADDGDE
jgi:hypothetical protein